MPQRAPYHDQLAVLMGSYRGRIFTAGEVRNLFRATYPGLRWDWVQPSDHCVNHICRDACHCAQTDNALFLRPARNTYVVL